MTRENLAVAVIKITDEVKENARAVAEAFAMYNELDYEDCFIYLICEFGFSEWCVRNRLWHEWNTDTDFGNFTCETRDNGRMIGVHVHALWAGSDFDPATEGIRCKFYDVHTNPQVDLHVLARYDGDHVHIYGGAAGEQIKQNGDIYELRPMVLNLPAEQIPVPADLLAVGLMQTEDEQYPLDGLLD